MPTDVLFSHEAHFPRLHEPVVGANNTVQTIFSWLLPPSLPPPLLNLSVASSPSWPLVVHPARSNTSATDVRGAQQHARERTYRGIRQYCRAELEPRRPIPCPGSGRPPRGNLPHPYLPTASHGHDPVARSRPRRRRSADEMRGNCSAAGGGRGE